MARILMIWELGAGYGHVGPLLSLATPLKAAGHEIQFAVRILETGEALLRDTGIPVRQAPANLKVNVRAPLFTYPQILKHTCFNEPEQMQERFLAWRALYAEFKPDLIVCDHSPSALLAARPMGTTRSFLPFPRT